MSVVDKLNKIRTIKVIDEKFDKKLKIVLIVLTLLGSAYKVSGEVMKIRSAAGCVPNIEKRLSFVETSIIIELKNIDERLKRIERKI